MFTDMLHRYALVSHLLLACSIGHISTTVTGFYDIITHFLSNKTCVAILYNYCLMLFIFCCKIPVMIFIGQLTRLETEELIESLRSYLTDSILFLVLSKPKHLGKELLVSDLIRSLAILLAIKAFHILLSNRLSHMFELEIPSFGRVLRVSSFIYVLSLVNVFLINFFVHNLTKKNTFTIWVIFELLGMMQSLLFSTIKFIVNLIDLYQQSGLVNKVTLLFYVELLQDMTSLVTFTTFMILFFVNNPINIPIYMIIDIIHVAKNLTGRIKMLIEYRKLSKVLNSRFPVYVATNSGETCIICRDALDDNSRKIDCGHAFHLNCLKSWLFQHASCPSCRTPIYSSSITEAPLIDMNSILYNMEQRVLIAMRKLFKLGDMLLGSLIDILVKTWPFNKVLKRRIRFKNKLCKVVLILSNKVEKQDSYECYFLDENNNITRLFDGIMSNYVKDKKRIDVIDTKMSDESNNTTGANVDGDIASGNGGMSVSNRDYTNIDGTVGGSTPRTEGGGSGTPGGQVAGSSSANTGHIGNTGYTGHTGNTGRSHVSSATTPRSRASSRRVEVIDFGPADSQVGAGGGTHRSLSAGTNTPGGQVGFASSYSRSQFTGTSTPRSIITVHNTPRSQLVQNTPRGQLRAVTPRSHVGQNTPGSQVGINTPRTQFGGAMPRAYTAGGMVMKSKSMPFIHTNPIGSITASLELNINIVSVIKRHRFNQLFFLAPNSSSRTSRTGGTTKPTSGQYVKERILLEQMLSLLNEKETTTEGCMKEIESNLLLLLPLFLASMGTMLGSFTQAAILSVLGPENLRARSDTVSFTNITTADSKAVYMKLVTRVGETENIDISSIAGTDRQQMSMFDVLKEEAMSSGNSSPANVRDKSPNAYNAFNNSPNAASTISHGATTGAGTNISATGNNVTAVGATPKSSRQVTSLSSNYSSTTRPNTTHFSMFGSNRYFNNGGNINTYDFTGKNYTNNGDDECILVDENLIKKEHVKFLVAAKDYSFLMLKLKRKRQLNVTDLLVNLQTIQSVVKNHL
ncbi:rING-type E3 ubiquitin transferase [Theileria orientalis]|uniref:RING-type E3 ubiquitin transferase n=1 Tax=Theileria orientalis TaxID=68886 RepID=A0A976M478_THEOR|nr:rING-type E3 ubiquitin transferase [Theileria orientalis]